VQSAAQQVISKMKIMLADRQVTAGQLWCELIKDDQLKNVLIVNGKPRKGVLRGVLQRINNGKVPGLKSIIDDNGHRKYEKDDDKLVDMERHFELLANEVESIEIDDNKLNGNQRRLRDKTARDIRDLRYDINEIKLAF